MNSQRELARAFVLVLLSVTPACTLGSLMEDGEHEEGSIDGDDWDIPMGGTRWCTTYWEECHEDYERCQDDCWTRAIYGDTANCSGQCMDLGWCVSYDESDRNRCARYDYRFEPRVNPEALAACERLQDWSQRCGEDIGTVDCQLWATVASPEVVAWVDRAANSACGDPGPESPVSVTGLGDELCVRINNACSLYQCREEWALNVNLVGGWVSQEVIAAAHACADESGCVNINLCLGNWTHTVSNAIVEGDLPSVTESP